MRHERNVDGLRQSAEKKRQESLQRTEEAIKQLIKSGCTVNFKTVAETAGVSTAWLYKEPEIKSRIEYLREQRDPKSRSVSPKQKATDTLKDAKYQALERRLQEVESENRGLRDHLAAIHGRQRVLIDDNEVQRWKFEQLTIALATIRAEIEELKGKPTNSLP